MSSWNSSTPRPSVQEETAAANPGVRCAHALAKMLQLSAERRQAGEALPRSHPPHRYVRDGDGDV